MAAGFGKQKMEAPKAVTTDKALGDLFTPATELKADKGLKIAVWGRAKVGKSHFALTPPKGNVYIIDTESAIKINIQNFPEEVRKRVFVVDILQLTDLKEGGNIDYEQILLIIEDTVNKIVKGIRSGEISDDVTVVIDSASDLWDWLGIWLRGRDDVKHIGAGDKVNRMEWEHANRRYEEAMLKLKMCGCNIICTYKAKDAVGSDGSDLGYAKPRWQKNSKHIFDISTSIELVGDKRIMKFIGIDNGGRYGEKIPDLENPDWGKLLSHLEKHCGVKF